MINKLIVENLRHRWVRTLLCALVVGVQVMAILTLVGLSRGLLRDSAQRAEGPGTDIFLKPNGAAFQLSSGFVLERFAPFVEKQPNVKQAIGVLIVPVGGTDILTSLNGVDIAAFQRFSGGFPLLHGSLPEDQDDVLVDESYAQQHHLRPGSSIKLIQHTWRVSGVIRSGMLGRLVANLRRLQDLTGNLQPTAKISQILVKVNDRNQVPATVRQLTGALEGNLTAISYRDFISQFSIDSIPQLRAFIFVITGLAVVVGFLVVFLSMYTAVVERTREIGILKALGAKPVTIVDMLVREAVFLAIAGSAFGIVLAFVAKGVIMSTAPSSLPVISVPDWWLIASGIAILGALLGALYPGLKAARQDAIEALSYE